MDRTEALEFCASHCEEIPGFMRTFLRFWSKPYEDIPFNQQQADLLMFVNQKERCKMSELAVELRLSPGAITQMVDLLVGQGFLERISHESDRRVVLVRLTPDAKAIIEKIRNRRKRMMIEVFSTLSKHEAQLLVSMIEKLEGNLRVLDADTLIKQADTVVNQDTVINQKSSAKEFDSVVD